MDDEIIGTIDPTNGETDQTDKLETEPEEVFEEPVIETYEDLGALKEKNKQLFARAKKAEGELKSFKQKPVVKPITSPVVESVKENDIDKLLDEKLEKRELEALDFSDELKKEVQTYAKVSGVTIKKALDSDYIKFKLEKEEKKRELEEASLGGLKKSRTKKDYSDIKPTDFDLKTPEGRADFSAYEDHLRKELG